MLLGLRFAERPAARILMGRLGLPLDRFGRRSPYRLSGGEQRRLSLATALVRAPAVLVLDEPTFGQDRLGYEGLLEILDERLAAGATLIAATHDQRFVADATSRSIELDGWLDRVRRARAVIADRLDLDEPRLASPLGRVSPVVKLAIAIVWLVGLALHDPDPAAAVPRPGRDGRRTVARTHPGPTLVGATAPLWVAAVLIGVSNTVFAAANGDPTAAELRQHRSDPHRDGRGGRAASAWPAGSSPSRRSARCSR